MARQAANAWTQREIGPARSPFFRLPRKATVTSACQRGPGAERSKTMFLRTQRLFLRPPWPEDAAELTRAIGQEAVVRMLSAVPWPYHEEHARSWIEAPRDPGLPSLLITLPEQGGRIVGCVGLHEEGERTEVG